MAICPRSERQLTQFSIRQSMSQKKIPLCVDLDGTLIKTDMLFESLCLLMRERPLSMFLVPLWLLRGRAFLKKALAERVSLDPSILPYHQDFLTFLKAESEAKRTIVLASASDRKFVQSVADHVGLFDDILASDGRKNLKGKKKLAALVDRYGEGGFDYAGNETADLPIWAKARKKLVVAPSLGLLATGFKADSEFGEKRSRIKAFLKAIRVHQWVKNFLLFVPIFMAHRYNEVDLILQVLVAFLSFSLCSSSVYVLNDLVDLENDRAHHRKNCRPFASGALPISFGMLLIPILLMLSVLLALLIPLGFLTTLAVYFVLTLAYSLFLKKIALIDIMLLASLYTVRIFAGGEAASTLVSQWLLAFSMFFFLSLACVKRFSELLLTRRKSQSKVKGRGYLDADLEYVANFGSACGYISVLVLALYINSEQVKGLYNNPLLFWFICPLILYWISRVWLLAHRGEMHDDPIVFAIEDWVSYLIGAMAVGLLLMAI